LFYTTKKRSRFSSAGWHAPVAHLDERGLKQAEAAGSTPVGRARPTTHYVVVREDLPRGVLAAQIVHAAGESSPGDLPDDTRAVVLAARNESHLADLESQMIRDGIPHRAIREPDPPWGGQLMAVGVVPTSDRNTIKHITGSLRLLR